MSDAAARMCSKCKKEPRAEADSSNPWCLKCRAKYQREYQSTLLEKEGGKGFGKGVQAMRELLIDQFGDLGSGRFSGDEVAHLIAQCPGPMPAKAASDAKGDGDGVAAGDVES